MRDVVLRKQQTHTRIETEAVIRLHREPTNRKKNEENRARACVYEKKVLPLHAICAER